MQVVHKVFKVMLVFCLSMLMMVGSAQADDQSCTIEPSFISFLEGGVYYPYSRPYYEYELEVEPGEASSLDVKFFSYERDAQGITLIKDPYQWDEKVENILVLGNQPTTEKGVFAQYRDPFSRVLVRAAQRWDIDMVVTKCNGAV